MNILLNTLHVVAAVFIVGPMAILPMTAMRSIRAGQAGQVATLAKSVNLFTLLSVGVVILGFGALGLRGAKADYSFASTWIWLSLVLYVIALALTLAVVVPALRSAAEALAADPATGAKVAGYSRIAMGSGISTLLLVVVVVLMAWKP